MNTRLCDLAEKYGCDKTKKIFHDYTPFYHDLLQRPVGNVLEIGIGNVSVMEHVTGYKPGASLRMWREYLPLSGIFGLDNDRTVLFEEHKIHTAYCDQSSLDSLHEFIEKCHGLKFDFIVDDGSHQVQHQAMTANTLIPRLLSKTGVYVIEDVLWRRELYPLLPFPVEARIFDLRRTPDDCLFVIEGANLF